MTEKMTTLHLSPLTGNPYPEINQYTYDFLTPEIQKLYKLNPSRLTYSYFGTASGGEER